MSGGWKVSVRQIRIWFRTNPDTVLHIPLQIPTLLRPYLCLPPNRLTNFVIYRQNYLTDGSSILWRYHSESEEAVINVRINVSHKRRPFRYVNGDRGTYSTPLLDIPVSPFLNLFVLLYLTSWRRVRAWLYLRSGSSV